MGSSHIIKAKKKFRREDSVHIVVTMFKNTWVVNSLRLNKDRNPYVQITV